MDEAARNINTHVALTDGLEHLHGWVSFAPGFYSLLTLELARQLADPEKTETLATFLEQLHRRGLCDGRQLLLASVLPQLAHGVPQGLTVLLSLLTCRTETLWGTAEEILAFLTILLDALAMGHMMTLPVMQAVIDRLLAVDTDFIKAEVLRELQKWAGPAGWARILVLWPLYRRHCVPLQLPAWLMDELHMSFYTFFPGGTTLGSPFADFLALCSSHEELAHMAVGLALSAFPSSLPTTGLAWAQALVQMACDPLCTSLKLERILKLVYTPLCRQGLLGVLAPCIEPKEYENVLLAGSAVDLTSLSVARLAVSTLMLAKALEQTTTTSLLLHSCVIVLQMPASADLSVILRLYFLICVCLHVAVSALPDDPAVHSLQVLGLVTLKRALVVSCSGAIMGCLLQASQLLPHAPHRRLIFAELGKQQTIK